MGTPLKNVLFVCPNESLLEAFNKFDVFNDWEIDYCQDSFSVLQLLKSSNYDLVVMDHEIQPLNPFKLMDYVFHELQKSCLMVIVGGGSEPEVIHENYIKFNYPIEQHNIDTLLVKGKESKNTKKKDELFSLDYLNELSDNNQEFLEESIQLFQNTLDIRLLDLKRAIAKPDFEEARKIAHNIKPSFAMLGNDSGRAICHTICYDATNDEIPELSQMLIKEYGLIINEIKNSSPN